MHKEKKYSPLEGTIPFLRRTFSGNEDLHPGTIVILLLGLTLAIALRCILVGYKSQDFFASLQPWYNTIKSLGFSAFSTDFSTYNPPYLYLLYIILRLRPDTPPVIGVKIPGLIMDFVCAYYVYRIVLMKPIQKDIAMLAGLAVLFAPTVIVNSAFWGQADSIYTAALAACLFYLMSGRNTLAMLAYGAALAFKLQAVFLAPFLFALFLRKMLTWKQIFLTPFILILAIVPSWIAGRPVADLLNIYLYQSSQFELITMNAPTVYTWIPQTKQVFNLFYLPAIIIGAIVAFLLVAVILKSKVLLTKHLLLELALVAIMAVPFFLPKMHERYFFPADVISIALAFYFPEFFYFPVVMSLISFLSYEPYFFNAQPIPLPILAVGLFFLICILAKHTFTRMYPIDTEQATDP